MIVYQIIISRSAEKELSSLPDLWFRKICQAVDGLALNPRPAACKKLTGQKNLWRIRINDYRVIYTIDDAIRIVSVERIAHRKDAYD